MQFDLVLNMFVHLTSISLLSFLIFILYFLSSMCMFSFSVGGASLTILRIRLTKGIS